MSTLRRMRGAFACRHLMRDGRMRRRDGSYLFDALGDAGQNTGHRSGGVGADLAGRFDRSVDGRLCSTTDVLTRLDRSLQDAVDGTPCHRADIRTHRSRMSDDRLHRFGRSCGNVASHLVHSQHDALRDALGAHDQTCAHLLRRLQGAAHDVAYHGRQFAGDRSRGAEGA